jgi:hypothetical protein
MIQIRYKKSEGRLQMEIKKKVSQKANAETKCHIEFIEMCFYSIERRFR